MVCGASMAPGGSGMGIASCNEPRTPGRQHVPVGSGGESARASGRHAPSLVFGLSTGTAMVFPHNTSHLVFELRSYRTREYNVCQLNLIVLFAKVKILKYRSSNSVENSRGCAKQLLSIWETGTNTM